MRMKQKDLKIDVELLREQIAAVKRIKKSLNFDKSLEDRKTRTETAWNLLIKKPISS